MGAWPKRNPRRGPSRVTPLATAGGTRHSDSESDGDDDGSHSGQETMMRLMNKSPRRSSPPLPSTSPPPHAVSPVPAPARRFTLGRGWLGCFLLVNLFAIAGFIFASAMYFPSSSSSGMVKQVLQQAEDVSLLELPGRGEAATERPLEKEEEIRPGGEEKQEDVDDDQVVGVVQTPETTATEQSPTVVEPEPSVPHETTPRLRSESDPATQEAPLATTAVATYPPVTHEQTVAPTTTSRHSVAFPTAPSVTTPVETSPREAAAHTPHQTMAIPTPTPLLEVEEVTTSTQEPAMTTAAEPTPADEHQAMETNLVVWLKADDGVEVENAVECETLGSACAVTTWKSVVGNAGQNPAVVFVPVSSAMRPELQPMAQNNQPLVAFSCGMAHTSGVVLHEMMTLFFVLSPSRIEPGDTYRSQKFFGNSPYGQFLFHGGRPAFFTAGGLRESSFVAANDELVLVTYRLRRHKVEIKANGQAWSQQGETPDDTEAAFVVRYSGNAALSLGNVKSACDTNAFQGRVAEVLVYNTVLSDTRVDHVERYLVGKWWGKNARPTIPTASEPPTPVATTTTTTTTTTTITAVTETKVDSPSTEPLPTDSVASTAPLNHNGDEAVTTEPTAAAEEDDERKGGVATIEENDAGDKERGEQDKETEKETEDRQPRTFDPEGVFEWLPSDDLLAVIAQDKGEDPAPLVGKWKLAVREKVDTVRNFQFGGEILRSFIRERRDELLALREELFGE